MFVKTFVCGLQVLDTEDKNMPHIPALKARLSLQAAL
jgi:hypothetical protein